MNSSAIELIYIIAISIVKIGAISRCIGLLIATFKRYRLKNRALVTKQSWIEICTSGEPIILFVVTYILITRSVIPSYISTTSLICSIIGALLAFTGTMLSWWTIYHFPKLGTGHYIENGQMIITTGPYRFVRHPIYLSAFFIWFSLSIGFFNLLIFLITILYVIPIYILYIKAEERMMLNEFKDEYKEYCERVGMIIPHFRK